MGMDGMAMMSGDNERRYKCPQCEFRGKWMFMIRKHQQVQTLTHFNSTTCLKRLLGCSLLEIQNSSWPLIFSIQCTCIIIFFSSQIHGIFACNFCEMQSQNEEELNAHLLENHGDRPGSKKCKKCHRYVKVRLSTSITNNRLWTSRGGMGNRIMQRWQRTIHH